MSKHDDLLTLWLQDITAGNVIIQAQFIPYEGSIFNQQVQVNNWDLNQSSSDETDWFSEPGTFYQAPIDLDNVTAHVTGFVTGAGHLGTLYVKTFDKDQFHSVNLTTTPTETLSKGDIFSKRHTSSSQILQSNLGQGQIPIDVDFSEVIDFTVPIGKLQKGDYIALGYAVNTTGTTPSGDFALVVTGVVDEREQPIVGDFFRGIQVFDGNMEGDII